MKRRKNSRIKKRESSLVREAVCLSLLGLATANLSAGAAFGQATEPAAAEEAEAFEPETIAEEEAAQGCERYDLLRPVGTTTPYPPVCYTFSPELGGLRAKMFERGWNVRGYLYYATDYDVLQDNADILAQNQTYNGQILTGSAFAHAYFLYDLGRLGLNEGARFTLGFQTNGSTFSRQFPDATYVAELSAYTPFANGRADVKVGYVKAQAEFYGATRGGSLGQSPLGPSASIPVQAGLSTFQPSPYLGVTVRDNSQRLYAKAAVTQSMTPDGVFAYSEDNRYGLKWSTPGASAAYVGEIGYKTTAAMGGRTNWIRAGAIYNTSAYTSFSEPGETDENQAYYLQADIQLTQSTPQAPPLGWYFGLQAGYAPDDTNVITTQYGAFLYKIGTFASRPQDLFGVSVLQNNFSEDARDFFALGGLETESSATTYSVSYAYAITQGFYLNTGLSYTDNPSFTPVQDAAMLASVALSLSF